MITVGGAPLQEDQRVGVESRLNELVENAAVASFFVLLSHLFGQSKQDDEEARERVG